MSGTRQRLFEDQLVEREIRDGLSQPGIFLLHLLEALGLVLLQATLFTTPTLITLLQDAQPAANLCARHALAEQHLGLAQKADDLLGGVSLPAPSNLLVCGSE